MRSSGENVIPISLVEKLINLFVGLLAGFLTFSENVGSPFDQVAELLSGREVIMKRNLNTQKEIKRMIATGVLLLVIFTFLEGCSNANFGYLTPSREVTKAFKTNRVFTDFRYYYLARGSRLYVIVGIHSSYELGPSSWKEVDLTTTRLNELIKRMEARPGHHPQPPFGSLILSPTGKQIGVWYSSIDTLIGPL